MKRKIQKLAAVILALTMAMSISFDSNMYAVLAEAENKGNDTDPAKNEQTDGDKADTVYDMTFYVGRDAVGENYNPIIHLYPTSGTDKNTGYDTYNEEEEIVLEGGEIDTSGQYRIYTASVQEGAYSYRAWGYDSKTEDYTNFLGGMSVKLPLSSNVTQTGYDASSVYIRTTSVSVKTKYDGINYPDAGQYKPEVVCPYCNCTATPGTPYVSDGITRYPYMLLAQGNACLYNYYVYPSEQIAEEYNLIFGYRINATVLKGYTENTCPLSMGTRITAALTVPSDAEAEVFFQMNNFRDQEIESYDRKQNEDGTATWYFYVPKSNGNYTYRVSKEGYVTKAGYLDLSSEETASFSVTPDRTDIMCHSFEDLDSGVAKRDEANLILNVSDQNEKNLAVDETFRLRAYRIWEIVNSDAGNIMIEPDFNFEILSGAECVSVTEVEDNRTNGKGNWLDIKGVRRGTAVIAVTYHAIDIAGTSTHGGFFPAISPERTGIVVVNVGDSQNDIQTTGVKNAYGNDWCWNYDTFYYIAPDKTGTMNLAPQAESGIASVEVAAVTTTDTLVSTMESWNQASEKDGIYQVPVVEGNNIIKVTSENGSVAYQVVRAAQIETEFENRSNPGESIIMPGNKVGVSFHGLYRSIPKVSGIFNPVTLQIITTGSDGTQWKGSFGQYQSADQAEMEVIIPEDIPFEEGSAKTEYTLSGGYMDLSFMFSYPDAWKFMYTMTDDGTGTCFNATNNPSTHTTISDIKIPVRREITFDEETETPGQDSEKESESVTQESQTGDSGADSQTGDSGADSQTGDSGADGQTEKASKESCTAETATGDTGLKTQQSPEEVKTTGSQNKTKIKVNNSKVKKAVKKKKSKKAKISLKKVKGVTGYRVKISTSRNFKKKFTITRKYKKNKITVKGLKPNRKYFVKVRAYKVVNGKYYYSSWSRFKTIRMK